MQIASAAGRSAPAAGAGRLAVQVAAAARGFSGAADAVFNRFAALACTTAGQPKVTRALVVTSAAYPSHHLAAPPFPGLLLCHGLRTGTAPAQGATDTPASRKGSRPRALQLDGCVTFDG
jgi:hypothetical protein